MADETTPYTDSTRMWSLACNCLLYEGDSGPAQLNIGSEIEPKMVDRQQAWRELYARLLIEQVDADVTRLGEAEQVCRDELADTHRPEHWERIYQVRLRAGDPTAEEVLTPQGQREIREVWECALDLCAQAVRMVREAGAGADETARQRFLAGLKHKNTVDVLGPIRGVAQDSAEELTRRLEELDRP